MKLNLIRNIINTRSVEMYLYSEIGGDNGVNAQAFADELNYVANYTDIEKVNVRINSPGGDVIAGIGIFSAIVNTNRGGKVQVDTYNDGIAASMAGVILLAGKNRFAKPFAKTMIHAVGMDCNPKDISDSDKATMATFSDMLNQVFTENTNKKSKFFSDLMSNGMDNWFTAKEAINAGILTDYEPDTEEAEEAETVVGDDLSTSAPTPGAIKSVCNKLNIFYNHYRTQKQLDMKKVIMKLNGRKGAKNTLADGATEAEIEKAVGEVIDENVKLEEDLTAEKGKVTDLQKKNDDLVEEAAKEVVKNAIEAGKFDKTKEAELIVSAKKDLPAFRGLVSATNSVAANITSMINKGGEASKDLLTKIAGKTLREIERMGKNSEIANKLKTDNIDMYVSLYNAQYNTTKTAADFK